MAYFLEKTTAWQGVTVLGMARRSFLWVVTALHPGTIQKYTLRKYKKNHLTFNRLRWLNLIFLNCVNGKTKSSLSSSV